MQFNQWHELSLLLSSYFIKSHGHRPIYIGKYLPLESLKSMSEIINMDYLVTTVNYNLSHDEIKKSIINLANEFSDKRLIFGGVSKESIPDIKPCNTEFTESLEELNKLLINLD